VNKNQKNNKTNIYIERKTFYTMDTDKLVKAIQIIVKEEIKVILPKLVKEGVKKEMAKLLKENKKLKEAVTPKQPTFMDSNVVEESVQPQKNI